MEDRSLEFCDHLLFTVFRLSGSNCIYRYFFPATSGPSQRNFDLCFEIAIAKIMKKFFTRVIFVTTNAPWLWLKNEENFGQAVESLGAYAFPSEDQHFLLMVHVAMLAVVFVSSGRRMAAHWAFVIIRRLWRRCDLRNQKELQLR